MWQLLNAPSAEEAIVDTVGRGWDTDTNAAICGALLGAVYGAKEIPERWRRVILACRPDQSAIDRTEHPRPAEYWPCDVDTLAVKLLTAVG